MSVPFPPLPEQQKIATILASVDDAIEKTHSVIDQLQVVKKAMMQELLTRGLPGRHTRFKQTEIGEVPEEWAVVELVSVAEVFNGKATGTGGSWLRVFKTKHVYDGNVKLKTPEFVRDDRASEVPDNTYLRTGDTLTPNMAHGTIGRVAYVPEAEANWTVDGQIMVIRSRDADVVDPRFLFEWMSSDRGKSGLLDREKGSIFGKARGQTHIYPADVRTMCLPVPPIAEQRNIAGALGSIDGLVMQNAAQIETYMAVKKGLMQQLLSGEVRVNVGTEERREVGADA